MIEWLRVVVQFGHQRAKQATLLSHGRKHFACQDSGLSQIFKLIVSSSEKRLNNINLVPGEGKLKRKTAHFR